MHRTEKFLRLHPCREPSSAGLIPLGVSWFGREAEANRERGVAALPFRIMTLLTSKSLHNSYGTPVPLHSSCETNSPQNDDIFRRATLHGKDKNVNILTFNCKINAFSHIEAHWYRPRYPRTREVRHMGH